MKVDNIKPQVDPFVCPVRRGVRVLSFRPTSGHPSFEMSSSFRYRCWHRLVSSGEIARLHLAALG